MADLAKILIADDSESIVEMLRLNMGLLDHVRVLPPVANGLQAMQVLQEEHPDLVIMDLILPHRDGMSILEEIARMPAPRPEVIILSAMHSEEIVTRVMNLGARYFMLKPFDVEHLCRKVREILQGPPASEKLTYSQSMGMRSQTLDEEIASVFLSIGIPAHIKGYNFLRHAVKMVMEEPALISAITKELYPGIAEHFDTSASRVERAIRHAIDVAWTRGRIDHINQIFGVTVYTIRDKPTNGEFIALLADKMKLERSVGEGRKQS